MKTIGLLGGISWVSTGLYYRFLNQGAALRRGRSHQAPMVIKSFDYQELFDIQLQGNSVGPILAREAKQLESIGAACIAICANTMHKHYDEVQSAVSVPVIHVADACAAALNHAGIHKVALLGTKYTMEEAFYKDRLSAGGIHCLIPGPVGRDVVERVIREELTRDIVVAESRAEYVRVIHELAENGAKAVILGCTEIGLLISADDCSIPVFDTTRIHCEALLDFALAP